MCSRSLITILISQGEFKMCSKWQNCNCLYCYIGRSTLQIFIRSKKFQTWLRWGGIRCVWDAERKLLILSFLKRPVLLGKPCCSFMPCSYHHGNTPAPASVCQIDSVKQSAHIHPFIQTRLFLQHRDAAMWLISLYVRFILIIYLP